ncbi:MAG: phosphomannomutase/phosphoglucomutase [Rickettsiaceae bacterium]
MINPAIFRAYDIRGNSHKDLSPEIAYKIGFCFAKIVISKQSKKDQNLICVGRDGRLSSEELCSALLQGINAAGVKVKYIGLVASPTLYFADKIFSASGSIMVTGSHNPKDDNGFKILKDNASFFGTMILDLKIQLEEFNWDNIEIKKDYKEVIVDIKEQYINRILLNSKISKDLKIAFDPANGAGGFLTSMLCNKLPCQTFMINEKIDGNFPAHDPDPTIAKNLQQLKEYVLKNHCDFGIGFDGDADRIGVITKKGKFVPGDQLLCLYAKDVITKIPKAKIIADVKASGSLFDYIEKIGGIPIMWKTGHSFIKSKMKETGAKLAGEMSGHIFFADEYYGYDDALYAAVRLIDIISNSSESIDDMIEKLPKVYNTPEIKLAVSDEAKFAIIDSVKLLIKNQNINFIDIDGLRVSNQHGWWLLRASNTGPAIIARCESSTQEGLQSIKNELKKILFQYNIKL